MNKFKVGDKVYCPVLGPKVYTVVRGRKDSDTVYPIQVTNITFTDDGKLYPQDTVGRLIHANEDNRLMLEKLYGIEFEKLPREVSGNKIVQAMLERGDYCVPCWVSDGNPQPRSTHDIEFITYVDPDLDYVTSINGTGWNYATPFDPRTGGAITELPE